MAAAPDFNSMFIQTLTPLYTEANEIATKVIAASGDGETVIHAIRDDANTTDAKVKEFQEYIRKTDEAREQAHKKIAEYIKANLVPAKDESFDVEAAKEHYKDLKGKISAGRVYAKGIGITDEELNAALPELKTLRGGTASSGSSAAGDGPKRPRITSVTVNGEDVSTDKKNDDGTVTKIVSFTVLGQYLTKAAGTKVEPGLIRDAVFEAAKTEDLSTVKGEKYLITKEINNKEFKVEVTV